MQLSIFNSPYPTEFFAGSSRRRPNEWVQQLAAKWTRTIDWKVKRFSAKISKAFDIVAVDVCHLSRNKTPYEVNLVCCFVGGLKWTRTIDLTLIRRVL